MTAPVGTTLVTLSFSFFTSKVENEAKEYAKSRGDLDNGRELAKLEKKYLDSVNNLEVINLGVSQALLVQTHIMVGHIL